MRDASNAVKSMDFNGSVEGMLLGEECMVPVKPCLPLIKNQGHGREDRAFTLRKSSQLPYSIYTYVQACKVTFSIRSLC